MASYAKFLKETLFSTRKLEEHKIVVFTEKCSAVIQNKLPVKLKDPSSFSLPYLFGNVSVECALCDLESSVSLMPLSL